MGVAGGQQRTNIVYDALTKKYQTDVAIIGPGVAPFHKEYFKSSEKIYEIYHKAPADYQPWTFLRSVVSEKLADRIASAFLPRRYMYQPDDVTLSCLKNIDLSEYDLVVSRFFRPGARAGVFSEAFPKPVMLDVDDRDDKSFLSRVEQQKSNPLLTPLLRNHANQVAMIMKEKLPYAAHLWLASKEDVEGLEHPSISVVPNIPFFRPAPGTTSPAPTKNDALLFVGSVEHDPNWVGVCRFLKNAWPLIHKEAPEATFNIVGGGWDRLPDHLRNQPGVVLKGFVDDLEAEYENAQLVVAPIFYGAGTKIKVVEAMGFARAVVADRHAAIGFVGEGDASGVVVTDGEEEMAAQCVALLRDHERATALGANAGAYVAQHFSRESVEEMIAADCERILEKAAA